MGKETPEKVKAKPILESLPRHWYYRSTKSKILSQSGDIGWSNQANPENMEQNSTTDELAEYYQQDYSDEEDQY